MPGESPMPERWDVASSGGGSQLEGFPVLRGVLSQGRGVGFLSVGVGIPGGVISRESHPWGRGPQRGEASDP